MDRAAIFDQFTAILADVLDLDDEPEIDDSTTARDIEEWDSLSNVRLIVAVERSFSIRFTNAEIEAMGCVGDLVNAIEAKAG